MTEAEPIPGNAELTVNGERPLTARAEELTRLITEVAVDEHLLVRTAIHADPDAEQSGERAQGAAPPVETHVAERSGADAHGHDERQSDEQQYAADNRDQRDENVYDNAHVERLRARPPVIA